MANGLEWQQDDNGLKLSGELTRATVPTLWQQRKDWLGDNDELVVNLAEVERVDSAGVAFLINTKRILKSQQRTLKIYEPNHQLLAIANISGGAELLGLPSSTN